MGGKLISEKVFLSQERQGRQGGEGMDSTDPTKKIYVANHPVHDVNLLS